MATGRVELPQRLPWNDAETSKRAAKVVRVVDGDTIKVKLGNRVETVRYIGVDTPETVAPGKPVECYGREASAFNHDLVDRREVELTFDRERRDRYGRLLAYVRLSKKPDHVANAELLRRGLAKPMAIPPNTARAREFKRLASNARRSGRGLWSACNAG